MLPSAAAASSVSSAIAITPAWLRSIDAVYALFEDSQLRQKHAELADKVQNAVKLCEDVVKELGSVCHSSTSTPPRTNADRKNPPSSHRLQHCALSFNGGKDCTVIVHILAAVLRRLYGYSEPAAPGIDHQGPPISGPPSSASSSSSSSLVPIPSVYITCPSPFPVLESFIRASQIRYNLDLYTVQGGMKEGLIEYFDGGGQEGVPPVEKREKNRVAEQQSTGHKTNRTVPGRKQRSVTAIFIGTRRTDPGGGELQRAPEIPASTPIDRASFAFLIQTPLNLANGQIPRGRPSSGFIPSLTGPMQTYGHFCDARRLGATLEPQTSKMSSCLSRISTREKASNSRPPSRKNTVPQAVIKTGSRTVYCTTRGESPACLCLGSSRS